MESVVISKEWSTRKQKWLVTILKTSGDYEQYMVIAADKVIIE